MAEEPDSGTLVRVEFTAKDSNKERAGHDEVFGWSLQNLDARTTFSPPTTMLAIIMSLMGLHAPVPRPARWRYPLSFGSTLGRRQLATDLLEDLVIRFEVFGEEVRGGIGRPGGSS